MNVLIRVDASVAIGAGHLMRCLTIAKHLVSSGSKVSFLTRCEYVCESLQRDAFDVELLPPDLSLEDELDVIASMAVQMELVALILDINNYSTFSDCNDYVRYLRGLKALPLCVVSFEDDKLHPPVPDIVVIPYAGSERLDVSQGEGCHYLLGPDYFVLNECLLRAKKATVKEKIESILVTMGGSDPGNLTLTVLRALNATDLDVKLDVVIGGLSGISDTEVDVALDGFKGSYSVLRDVSDMGAVMSTSDLAVINSGLTKYEAASLGLASVVISINEHHAEVMHAFSKTGASQHLGMARDVEEKEIGAAVVGLANDPESRREMSDAGKSVVDGRGVDRIMAEISRITDVQR